MQVSRVFLFGSANFTRDSIPEILADFGALPTVDTAALSPEAVAQYEANLEAYRLFVLEPYVSLAEIRRRTGVHEKQLYRLLDRVVTPSTDNQIQGLRGLIPGKHVKAYTRVEAIRSSSKLVASSAAGALQQLLRKFPEILSWIRKEAKNRITPLKKGEMRQVRRPTSDLHNEFLKKCRAEGVTEFEWPFNQDYRGYRSFVTLLKKCESEYIHRHTGPLDGPVQDREHERPDAWPLLALQPFAVVQFDGHKVDLRVTIVAPDPFGMETLIEIGRIWILVVTDVRTRAILGYSIALGAEYNKDDFAEAVQASLAPHRRVELTIPGLKVKDGGGFPIDLQPELAYHRWTWFQFDEAKAHLANDSLDRLNKVLGTWTIAGRLGEPNDRAYQERLFGILEEHGFHRIPGTLGSNPKDPRRKLADVGNELDRVIKINELEQLIYVLLANRNAEPQSGVGGRSALDAMRYLTSKPDFLLQTLPHTKRHQLFLLRESVEVTIRGANTFVHINFVGVRYTSDTLARKPELIGSKLRIYYIARDIRKIHAFFLDGGELGILIASKQWRTTPHSLRLRQEILRLKNLGRISWGAQDDPIEKYLLMKRGEAKDSKRAASKIAQTRANIEIANADALESLSPFASSAGAEPEYSAQEADAISAESKRKPSRTEVEPTPVTVNRTIFF